MGVTLTSSPVKQRTVVLMLGVFLCMLSKSCQVLSRCLLKGKEFSPHFAWDVLRNFIMKKEMKLAWMHSFVLHVYRFTRYQGPGWKREAGNTLRGRYLRHIWSMENLFTSWELWKRRVFQVAWWVWAKAWRWESRVFPGTVPPYHMLPTREAIL